MRDAPLEQSVPLQTDKSENTILGAGPGSWGGGEGGGQFCHDGSVVAGSDGGEELWNAILGRWGCVPEKTPVIEECSCQSRYTYVGMYV
ncbi:hypothetical protein E3N88_24117 [Mikania micrantha]|uniref:Uncharacterized protein n=1 Tax=Mikania micrantha TaxID=192012 RepID=A0A5N6NF43_9ASTR|nr:hypothetical protein E3N88_24117 [Mikania micrantha]